VVKPDFMKHSAVPPPVRLVKWHFDQPMKLRQPKVPPQGCRWYDLAEAAVRAVRGALPAELRDAAAAVPVVLEDIPGRDLADAGFPDDLLGLFDAPTYAEGVGGDEPRPPAIRLFVRNLRDEAADDPDTFREEVRITYLHELGHFLGLDEDALAARGLE